MNSVPQETFLLFYHLLALILLFRAFKTYLAHCDVFFDRYLRAAGKETARPEIIFYRDNLAKFLAKTASLSNELSLSCSKLVMLALRVRAEFALL